MHIHTNTQTQTHTVIGWVEECEHFPIDDTELFEIGNETIELVFLKDFPGSKVTAALEECKIVKPKLQMMIETVLINLIIRIPKRKNPNLQKSN